MASVPFTPPDTLKSRSTPELADMVNSVPEKLALMPGKLPLVSLLIAMAISCIELPTGKVSPLKLKTHVLVVDNAPKSTVTVLEEVTLTPSIVVNASAVASALSPAATVTLVVTPSGSVTVKT